jgi:glycosyltransferase involved in cell wall biosynthesis
MKVLQFICPAGLYGAEMWILALKNSFNGTAVDCQLAVSQESSRQNLAVADRFTALGGRVHYLKMGGRFDLRIIKALSRLLEDQAFDIIHTHGYKSDIIGLAAARLAGVAAVATPHGFENTRDLKLQMFIRLGNLALRFFDRVAPLSEALMQDMARIGVPGRKVRMIRNGVDLGELEAFSRVSPQSDGRPFTIGYVGQMASRKNVGDLIRCFDLFNARHPESRLVLVGDGPRRSQLETLAASLPSAARIDFLGYREDRLEIVRTLDLFCMTSSLEGIPRCMMEAMGLGIPVAAYDIPGIDQLIVHGKTGLTARFGDVKGLCDCWQQVYSNRETACKLGESGKGYINDRYSARRMAADYFRLYAGLLGRR